MHDSTSQEMSFLLADDHLIVRQGMQFVIEELYPDAKFSQASNLNQVIEKIRNETFDVLILDAQFPDGISLSILPEIRKIQPKMKILVFTSFEEEHYSLKFIEAGANGFLSKLSEASEIKTAVSEIIENQRYYPPLTEKLLELVKFNPNLANPLNQLSEREMQIAALYAKGFGNLEIANELDVKQNTVSTLKKRIFEKLAIDSVVELIELMKIHHSP